MNRRTFLTTLGTAMTTVAAGCAAEDPTPEEVLMELDNVTEIEPAEGGADIGGIRAVDDEAGVVLYNLFSHQGNGVAAIPKEETDL